MSGIKANGVNRALLLVLVVLLAGCGEGGVGPVADGGIRGTGSSVGPVSGFGSVVVNGVRFDTDNASISGDGVSEQDDLEIGMLVQIDGLWEADGLGVADSVVYDDTLRGPVTAVTQPWDPLTRTGRIRVMGLEVLLDAQTRTDFAALADIGTGDFVRVSGWLRDDGLYRASFIGALPANNEDVEVEGFIDSGSLNTDLDQFRLGGLRISYRDGTVDESILTDETRLLDIQGRYLVDNTGPYIQATAIRPALLAELSSEDRDLQLAGVATLAFSGEGRTGSFELNGIPVQTSVETEFDDLAPSDIQPGLLLQVEGRLESGVIFADEVELREADAELEGVPIGNSFNLDAGTFELGGVTVRVGPYTRIEMDEGDERALTFDDLLTNQRFTFDVEGIQRFRENLLDAIYIEVDDEAESGFELQGRVTAVNLQQQQFVVLGVTIMVDSSTGFDDSGQLEELTGAVVEVKYSGSPATGFFAEEIELEDD